MTCHPIKMPGGATGFFCTRERTKRCSCGNRGVFLCDWKVPEKKSGTCDVPLCGRCAFSPADEKHLCKPHAGAWAEWRKAQRLKGEANG